MLTSVAFAKLCIDRIVTLIQNVRCRYEYHEASYTHFIEVVPNSVYKFDQKFISIEEAIVSEFESKFPTEYISFITSDSIYKITNPIYVASGSGYTTFTGLQYATYDYLLHLHSRIKEALDCYGNVATRHSSVKMANNNQGCIVVPEDPPQIIVKEYQKVKTLYDTESLLFM